MPQDRQYQQHFIQDIYEAFKTYRSVLGVMPTGGGKTFCFCTMVSERDGPSAVVVHRQKLVQQVSMALAGLGIKHRIVAPKEVTRYIRRKQLKRLNRSYIDNKADVGVVSVHTLTHPKANEQSESLQWFKRVTFAVFDEGHHYVKQGQWAKAVNYLSRAKMLFVTATPQRADGKGLGIDYDGFCETIVEMRQGPHAVRWLIDNGYLCDYKYYAPRTDVDLSDLVVTASGDFNSQKMRLRIEKSHLVGDLVSHYKRFLDGKKMIVFANDVDTAKELESSFNESGVNSVCLSYRDDQAYIDKSLKKFEDGALRGAINVDMFDEGFDVPDIDGVLLGRLTASLAKFLQMIGRVLRPVYADGYDLSKAEGRLAAIANSEKPYAIIVDPVGNWAQGHGMPDWPRIWALAGKQSREREKDRSLIPQVSCLECTQIYEKVLKACPYCGASPPEPKGRSAPEQVDGDLFELDTQALRRLLGDMDRMNMSREEYAADQLKRHIPYVGRAQDMRRFLEAKDRRKVLENLVGYWVGMQTGRDLGEIHRRFYYRFGVDIGTAFTLKAKQTDALIEIIKTRFEDDLR